MTTTTGSNIRHETFCPPRPGATAPRIETYTAERTGSDGVSVTSRPVVVRCIECGAQTVDGTPVG